MRKLLWIGDAACDSGFARCTHGTLEVLRKTWDVTVLGLNYKGDPHSYPYPIYPCFTGGDIFGLGRVNEILEKIPPDCVVVQNDPWNIPAYLKRTGNIPTIASLAVDGKNCRGYGMNGLALAIFWTHFAAEEARLGGYSGPAAVIPLGVDLDVYYPEDRRAARQQLLPKRFEDAFIVGNINRNQTRKRLDLCIAYFAEWVKSRRIGDAYLFLHVAPTGDDGFDCRQLAAYYGIQNRLIIAEPNVFQGLPEDHLRHTYNCFDIMATTTQGEGWGLTTMEGMACGVPSIVPDWAALGEWTEDASYKVPCTSIAHTPGRINVQGGVADREAYIEALDTLYRDKELRSKLSARGHELVKQEDFRWPNIGKAFAEAVENVLTPVVVRK